MSVDNKSYRQNGVITSAQLKLFRLRGSKKHRMSETVTIYLRDGGRCVVHRRTVQESARRPKMCPNGPPNLSQQQNEYFGGSIGIVASDAARPTQVAVNLGWILHEDRLERQIAHE